MLINRQCKYRYILFIVFGKLSIDLVSMCNLKPLTLDQSNQLRACHRTLNNGMNSLKQLTSYSFGEPFQILQIFSRDESVRFETIISKMLLQPKHKRCISATTLLIELSYKKIDLCLIQNILNKLNNKIFPQ